MGNNKSSDRQSPLRWSPTEHVVWKAPVPGRGHATPCVFGDQIFIATADEERHIQFLLCYDRRTGQLLWQTEIHRDGFMRKHEKNSHASATPACDGEHVFLPLMNGDALWLTALDLQGNIKWQQEVGPFDHGNGYGSSPVLYESLVIVTSECKSESCLAAFECSTGNPAWRVERRKTDNFATPIVGQVAGRPQLLINGARSVSSYEPKTGKSLWHVRHSTEVAACTMAFEEDLVFASGRVPEKDLLCVRADGSGDVSDTHVEWRTNKLITYVPSPLVHEGRLYLVNDDGIARCLEAHTGEELWRQRLEGEFSASPLLAAGNIYATNEAGTTFVFGAGPEFELVARNDIGEECLASPVICGGRVFLRTSRHLYCLGNTESPLSRPKKKSSK